MRAWILTIGDELLIGQVVNTNASWIGERLTALGATPERMVTVSDAPDAIRAALGEALAAGDLVVATGGLGPTHDDVTRAAVCDLYGVSLRLDEGELERVKARFARRGIPMPETNRSQALIPDGFEALPNPVGTAAGLLHPGLPERGWGLLVVLPGVPHEMTALMEREVLPRLARTEGLPFIVQKTLLTTGSGESSLQEAVGPLDDLLGPMLGLAYLPSVHGVRLRITGRGPTRAEAEERAVRLERRLVERIGRFVYGEGSGTLEEVVGAALRAAGLTIATAESCTGGLVAHRLTNVPGSSEYVAGGVVAYDNRVKIRSLGVEEQVLASHGAVSRPVAEAMAEGVRRSLGTDLGLASTGIMGPGGGTEQKPVGTVWIALADARGVRAMRLRLGHDRLRNKEQAATAALDLVRLHLLGRFYDPGAVV
jgi:nicotinamide-nucleotide amidase